MTIRKQEVAGLTLQQACSIQEQLNSEMAIADSKLRNAETRNDKQALRKNKKYLEEVYCVLCDHIENLSIA